MDKTLMGDALWKALLGGVALSVAGLMSRVKTPELVEGLVMFDVTDDLSISIEARGHATHMDMEWDHLFLTDCPRDRLKELVREAVLEAMGGRRDGAISEAIEGRFHEAGWFCMPARTRVAKDLFFDIGMLEES